MPGPDPYRYAKKVRTILLSRGADGIIQSELYTLTKTPSYHIDELTELLNTWRVRRWVQRFMKTTLGAKRPAVVWRATTLLRDEWPTLDPVAQDLVSPDSAEEAA